MEDRRLAVACLGLADGSSAGELDGAWLVSYDPAGGDGYGEGAWSQDPADAALFTAEEWAALWTAAPANRPLRPDGKQNRPITRFGLMMVPVDPGRLPSILPPGPDGRPLMGDAEFVAHVLELAGQAAGPPPRAPASTPAPPRQVESEADFLKRLSRIRAEAEAKHAAASVTPAEADELRAMGLM